MDNITDNENKLADSVNIQPHHDDAVHRETKVFHKSTTPLLLEVSEDKLELKANGDVRGWQKDELINYLIQELKSLGITKPEIVEFSKNRLLEIIEKEEIFHSYLLYRGKPPVPPVEGRIEWAQDFFAKGFETDPETGAVDYRRPKAKRNVTKGQLLATIIKPVEGVDGEDVYGKPIHAPKPKHIHLTAGRNVRATLDNAQFYATIDGLFRLDGNVIHVDDLLEIHGSVGLETGDIQHLGFLIIHKNIEAESTVEAEGDIEVKGYIEQANVTTKGKLLVYSGITGKHGKIIKAKDTITAKYLLNATVESEEGIYISKEIAQSFVRTRGPVVVAGRIVGGEIIALGGIKADQIGSEACIRTTLIVGEDYFLRQYLMPLEKEKEEKEELMKKILNGIIPLKNRWQTLPTEAKNAYLKLVEQLKSIKQRIDELTQEINKITEESAQRAHPEVIVRQYLYPDVFVNILGSTFHNKEFIKGPLKLALVQGSVHLLAT